MIWFHGDGPIADGWDAPIFHESLQRVAAQKKILLVALKIPEKRTDEQCWPNAVRANSRYVQSFTKKILESVFKVPEEKVAFAGVSGGAMFLPSYMTLSHYRSRAGFILLCGFDRPREDSGFCDNDNPPYLTNDDADERDLDIPIFVALTRYEMQWPAVTNGIEWHKSEGFRNILVEARSDEEHCKFGEQHIADVAANYLERLTF